MIHKGFLPFLPLSLGVDTGRWSMAAVTLAFPEL